MVEAEALIDSVIYCEYCPIRELCPHNGDPQPIIGCPLRRLLKTEPIPVEEDPGP